MRRIHVNGIVLGLVFAAMTLAGVAAAGPTGEYFAKDGVAIRGYDPVAYFMDHKPVKGSPDFTVEHRGSTFHFVSASNRDAFAANPEKFLPQYGGFCAFGMAKGYKATTDPAAYTIVGGRLYLNYSLSVRELWQEDIPGNIRKADANWPEVKKSTKVSG